MLQARAWTQEPRGGHIEALVTDACLMWEPRVRETAQAPRGPSHGQRSRSHGGGCFAGRGLFSSACVTYGRFSSVQLSLAVTIFRRGPWEPRSEDPRVLPVSRWPPLKAEVSPFGSCPSGNCLVSLLPKVRRLTCNQASSLPVI